MGIFEVLASEEQASVESRAVIAAQTRVKEQFGSFVAKASDQGETDSRVAFLSTNIREVVAEVADEYGYDDADKLEKAATVALGGGHASDCSCGFCENKGKLPGEKSEDEDGNDPDAELKAKTAGGTCAECHHPMDKHHADGTSGENGKGCELCDCTRGLVKDDTGGAGLRGARTASVAPYEYPEYNWEKVAAEVEDGDTFSQERVDLPSSETGVGGPSPKIDKSDSGSNEGWTTEPIEVPSTQHPTERQDILAETPDYAADLPGVSETGKSISADTPLQPEFNTADHTDTWTGTESQADPVTSAVLAKYTVLDT